MLTHPSLSRSLQLRGFAVDLLLCCCIHSFNISFFYLPSSSKNEKKKALIALFVAPKKLVHADVPFLFPLLC